MCLRMTAECVFYGNATAHEYVDGLQPACRHASTLHAARSRMRACIPVAQGLMYHELHAHTHVRPHGQRKTEGPIGLHPMPTMAHQHDHVYRDSQTFAAAVGLLLANYGFAMWMGLQPALGFRPEVMVTGHALLAALLVFRAWKLDTQQ